MTFVQQTAAVVSELYDQLSSIDIADALFLRGS